MSSQHSRPARVAGTECKRRLHEQFASRRKRGRASPAARLSSGPEILNDRDAITLDPVDLSAPTTFLALADAAGKTAYAHDAVQLFRFCVESVDPPHDPVTMRPYGPAECRALEERAGEPTGSLAAGRASAHEARQTDQTGSDLGSDDNQAAMMAVLSETIREAVNEAVRSDLDDLIPIAGFVVAEFKPMIQALVGVLHLGGDNLTAIREQLDGSFAQAGNVADRRPHASALVMMISDAVMEVLRERVHEQMTTH